MTYARVLICLVMLLFAQRPMRAQVVTSMTPKLVLEAIALGNSGRKLGPYEWKRPGPWKRGGFPLGGFTTPFLRVALAARRARQLYQPFTPDDVTAEMIAPTVHVIAPARIDGLTVSDVQAVVFLPKGANDRVAAIHPSITLPISREWQNYYGAKVSGAGKMAVFPIEALSDRNELHIVYESSVADGGPLCTDCPVTFGLKRVR